MPSLRTVACTLLFPAADALRDHAKRTSSWPIKTGYVAFGDSYAAGIGTGNTSTDICHIGSNNFGRLLYNWTNNTEVDYQELMCSGDGVVGVHKQIEKWQNPEKADLATLSVGANDLFLGTFIQYCVLSVWDDWTTQGKCKNVTDSLLTDNTTTWLHSQLNTTYLNIMHKSPRSDFHLYVTGYPHFFDVGDQTCNDSTLDYWSAQYTTNTTAPGNRLSKDLRNLMNGFIDFLNAAISAAVTTAQQTITNEAVDLYQRYELPRVHFVNTSSSFAGHLWCEPGVQEPVESNSNNSFFLWGWQDMPINDPAVEPQAAQTAEMQNEQAQLDIYKAAGSIHLPNSTTCVGELGTDPDPWAVWICLVAAAVGSKPSGKWAALYNETNAKLATKGDVTLEDVAYWLPTRQLKTFHLRSPGMVIYQYLIMSEILKWQTPLPASRGNMCKMNVTESWTCDQNLYANITFASPTGSIAGEYTGLGIIATADYYASCILEDGAGGGIMYINGYHSPDHIHFNIDRHPQSNITWDTDGSNPSNDGSMCMLVGDAWDESGPQGCPSAPPISRTFECQYACNLSTSSRV